MTMDELVNLLVNNGVAIGVIVYFLYRDNKWTTQLQKTLDTLDASVQAVKELIENHLDKGDDKDD